MILPRPGFCPRCLSGLCVCTHACVSADTNANCQVESCPRPFTRPPALSSPAADPCFKMHDASSWRSKLNQRNHLFSFFFFADAHDCARTDLICLRLPLLLCHTHAGLCVSVPASALRICINKSFAVWISLLCMIPE